MINTIKITATDGKVGKSNTTIQSMIIETVNASISVLVIIEPLHICLVTITAVGRISQVPFCNPP